LCELTLGSDEFVDDLALSLWVPNWSSASCDLGVFMYQPAEQIATSQVKLGRRCRRW
jgi:hypothetical protein